MKRLLILCTLIVMLISSFLYSQTEKESMTPQLVYSTFLGGSGNDATWWLDNMAIDDSGNVCFAIDTDSKDIPVTEDAYDKTYNGGNMWGMEDIAIVKFNIENNRPEYVSYLGGNGPEFVTEVFVEGNNMYLTGNLGSTDFPVTENAFDKTFNGPDFRHADGFFSKFTDDNLVTSSYVGSGGNEGAFGISVNNNDYIVIATQLAKPSELGIATDKDSSDEAYACVLLFNSTGDSLLSSIKLGYSSSLSSVVDDEGYVYLAGSTSDQNFPVTSDAYDTDFNGGVKEWKGDFFITKLSPHLDKIIFSTYIGGSGDESYPRIVLDKENNIILFGSTESDDYPLTEDAFQSQRKGTRDFVITKLSSDGKNILYSSLLGSNENEMESNAEITINKNGDICLAGCTDGLDFPVTNNALYATHNGKKDIFFTILSSSLNEIKYSTYIGGKEDDMLPSLLFTDENNIVITATTFSGDFPVTEGTYSTTKNNASDIVLMQFSTSSELSGDYFGQTPPGNTPKVFASGIISTDDQQHSAAMFSPDGNEVFWWVNYNSGEGNMMTMRRTDDTWSSPEVTPYSGTPVFSPDGSRLYFEGAGDGPYYVEKQNNEWSEIKNVGLVNKFPEVKFAYNLSIAQDGTLYFLGSAEGFGLTNNFGLYKSQLIEGEYAQPELLPPSINAPGNINWTPFIAPDGSYLIFSSSRGTSANDNGDLYICFQQADDTWSEPASFGEIINTNLTERYPAVSPDGKYLFFTRENPPHNDDVFWVSAEIIDSLKKNVTGVSNEIKTGMIKEFELLQNYPNPFNPSTTIKFTIPKVRRSGASPHITKLVIYNILGQKVKTLVNDFLSPGEYSITWDSTDNNNNLVSSGVYFYSLAINEVFLQKKMILIR